MVKIALGIASNYPNSPSELGGCLNDLDNITEIQINHLGYKKENIIRVADDVELKPNRRTMTAQLLKFAQKSYEPGVTEGWFHYSGHGSNVVDRNGDESDGRDECMIPTDYDDEKNGGVITDDDLNSIFSQINPDIRLFVCIDACHSGTMLDLPYRYISGIKNVVESKLNKIKCRCLMISGCRDNQTSSDAYGLNNTKEWSGAMTSALIYVLKEFDYQLDCWTALKHMRKYLRKQEEVFTQVPQMTSNEKLSHKTKLVEFHHTKPFIGPE